MTRRRAILAAGAAALAVVLLVGWPGNGRTVRTARPTPVVVAAEPAPERRAEPRAVTRVTEFPRGSPVPREELVDDPNRVPGPELRIAGFVVRSGRPVEDAVVRLCRAYPSGRFPEPLPHPFAETSSLDDGSFALWAARRSSLVVEVRHDGSAIRRLFLVMPLVGDPEPVRVELARGHDLGVKVIEPEGRPVSGARVRLQCAGGATAPVPIRPRPEFSRDTTAPRVEIVAKTDGDGLAVFNDIEAGRASLEVEGVLDDVVVPTGMDVVFIHERRGTVEGTLRRQDGHAIADATLRLETLGGFRDRRGYSDARTDAEGRFRVEDVPPGWMTGGRVDGSRVDATPVLLRPGGVVEWNPVIRPSTGIRGRTTGADGSPLANVRVLLLNHESWPDQERDALDAAWSDDAGLFELRAPEAGEYVLRAEAFGLLAGADVTAPCRPLDLRLLACSRVVGRIRGLAEGNDLAKVSLSGGRQVPLDAAGRFVFERVAPARGAWIGPGNYGLFDVPAGAVVEIDESYRSRGEVEAEYFGRIVGEVRDLEGRPVAGAVVSYPEYGFIDMKFILPAWGHTTATDDDGRFDLRVHPGWLKSGFCVAVARPGFAPRRSKPFFGKSQPGEVERLDFTLEPSPPLHGRVVDARGEPVRYAYVEAHVTAPKDFFFEESTYTAHDGAFRFTRLPHGHCRISAWADDANLAVAVEAEMGDREVLISLPDPENATISGIVFPTDSGPARLVVASSAAGTFEATIRESGRFRLRGLPPGDYDVRVEGGIPVRNVPTGTDDLVLQSR